jgi:tripartite-type tricarboxylate transporter receptor subunit TctC
MNISSWYGLFAPAKTPQDVVDKINASVLAFQKTPEAQKWMRDERSQATPLTAAEFATDYRRDLASMSLLLKDLGLKL